ncbi:MAG: ChaN family lipoprotein [Deltaproteobacteria bacterium]|nr:ChaN family lipoprotein [Deltaproteobacteria bacterium]
MHVVSGRASRALLVWALALTLPGWGAGCGASGAGTRAGAAGPRPAAAPSPLLVFDGSGHSSMGRLALAAAAARAVYVGEEHSNPHHHAIQLRVLEEVYGRDHSLAIGLEMVQRPFQPALDRWGRGELGEDALQDALEWKTRWGFDWALYAPIFRFAQTHKIPLVALNARRELTKRIAKVGVDALNPAEKAEMPELVLDDADHRAMVVEMMGGHHGTSDPASFDRMYAAQVTWDETMADSVARWLARADAPRRIVVLAGEGHVQHGLGIPKRAARRGIAPFVTVLPAAREEVTDLVQAGAADYVVSW